MSKKSTRTEEDRATDLWDNGHVVLKLGQLKLATSIPIMEVNILT